MICRVRMFFNIGECFLNDAVESRLHFLRQALLFAIIFCRHINIISF